MALNTINQIFGRGGYERMVCLSPPTVVSLNPVHGEVYSIQHYDYVVKFVSDLQQVGGFLWFTPIKLTITFITFELSKIVLIF